VDFKFGVTPIETQHIVVSVLFTALALENG